MYSLASDTIKALYQKCTSKWRKLLKLCLRNIQTAKCCKIMDNLFPLMLVNHREALYNIVAVTTGKTVEAVKKQPLADTKADFDASICDDMFDFFLLFLRMAVRA